MKLYPLKKMPILRMTLDSRLNWEEHIKSQSKESIKYYKSGSRKEIGSRSENHKKLYSTICKTKMDYECQLYNTATAGRLKKHGNIHRERIRIYTGVFKTLPVESLHIEANDQPLEPRFLYKLKSNSSYIETLNTLDNNEDQNYEENESPIKPTGV